MMEGCLCALCPSIDQTATCKSYHTAQQAAAELRQRRAVLLQRHGLVASNLQ